MSDLVVIGRLLLSALLTGLVGYERERHGRAAGFRTHLLVGMGSCLIMLTALYLMDTLAGRVAEDPTRMAAQVISGIGFLGAGTILRFRASVRGLTTAASLWAVAGIGLAAGAGFTVGAVATTIAVLIALFGFSRLERRMRKDWYQTLIVESGASGEELVKIRRTLGEYEVEIRDLDVKPAHAPGVSILEFDVKLMSAREKDAIITALERVEGVRRAYWT
ncbi:MAG: MgtC/SapB family protein [Candidatus Omnitrophica bacterium]|nr:MgtC/SapB family protein [Candidatus Omnitrophota bacterium]